MQRRRTLLTLYACNLITALGVWFFIPLLPIFIGRRGGSPALVGAVFAAGLISNAAVRYPAGWLADRYGTRIVMVVAMAAYAVFFLAYLLPLPVVALVAVRFFQGAAAGAYWPAANGLIGNVTDSSDRARAFGWMQSTNMAGAIVGPAAGGLVALFDMNLIMVISGAICAIAAIAVGSLPRARVPQVAGASLPTGQILRRLAPLLVLGAGASYLVGSFDTTWPLYMTYRGATVFEVGLSFTLIAAPLVVFSATSSRLSDRVGARRLIVGSVIAMAAFNGLYPFVTSVWWLIAIAPIGASLFVAAFPTLLAEVSRLAPAGQQGRTQGMYQTVQVSVQVAGAIAGGTLFSISPGYTFWAVSVVCLLAVGTSLLQSMQSRGQVAEANA